MDGDNVQILPVEDNEDHVGLIRGAFDDWTTPVTLTLASTLKESRAHLADSHPDLVITDIHLSDGDGMELLQPDEDKRRCPIVVMTAYGDEKMAAEAIRSGAFDYVVKSVESFADLPRIAERALRWREHVTERVLAF